MRNYLFFLITILSFNSYGQDTGFGIRSIEQNMGASTTFSNYYDFGMNFGLDISANYNKHLYALRFDIGVAEIGFWPSGTNQYFNFNFMYGRKFSINSWLKLEWYAGAGYLIFGKENEDTDWIYQTNKEVNLPISLKFFFLTGKIFNMGLNPNININSFQILYTTNLTLQFRFR